MPLLDRVVGEGEDGERADVVLSRWLDEPRGRAQARLAAGEVLVAGEAASKARRLRRGEQVVVAERPEEPAPPAPPVPIRFEDDHLLVVAKPAGMVVHHGAGTTSDTPILVASLQAMGIPLAPATRVGPTPAVPAPDSPPAPGVDLARPGIVHRLDRGTSGLLVVAKTPAALERLAALFRAHDVEREYFAIVDGVPDPPRATIDAPIARSTARRTRFTVDPGGRPAVTHYDLEDAYGRASTVRVRLETGRTHQVRVHLSSVGHPVSGDRAYGASRVIAEELGLQRPALHARRLAFRHPITGEPVACDEPLPADLTAALAHLRTPS